MKNALLLALILSFSVSAAFANSPQFLWKPVSESNGRLVVLFPSKIRLETVQSITINENFRPASTSQTGANGDRIHARFDKPGKDYGNQAVVKVVTKSGQEFTWTIPRGKDRYEKITEIRVSAGSSENNSTFGELISAETPEGALRLTNESQGTKDYEVLNDGEITVDCVLNNYGPAEMWIKDENENVLLNWVRSDDRDPAMLTVNGEEIADSNQEVKPGDFTPTPQKVKIEVKAGQILKVHLSGDFGQAQSYLVINE